MRSPRLARLTTFAGALVSLVAFAGAPTPTPAPSVSVVDPWVRLPPPGAKNTGAFMLLKNEGSVDRTLVQASNAASKVTELHTHLDEGGVKKMRQVPSIAIKAGGTTELKPGSLHVMLMDLVAPLHEGQRVPLTLTFDDASTLTVQAVVRRFDLPAPAPTAPMAH